MIARNRLAFVIAALATLGLVAAFIYRHSPSAVAAEPPQDLFVYPDGGAFAVVMGPDAVTRVQAVTHRGERLPVDPVGVVVQGAISPEGDTLIVERVKSEARKYWLHDRGIRCVTDPCPSVELYDSDGNRFEVAGIDLASSLDDALLERMLTNPRGARVRGFVAEGSWQPHDTGNVLTVTFVELVKLTDGPACWGAWLDRSRNCRTSTDRFYPSECCVYTR